MSGRLIVAAFVANIKLVHKDHGCCETSRRIVADRTVTLEDNSLCGRWCAFLHWWCVCLNYPAAAVLLST